MRHIRDPVTGRCMVCDKNHAFPTTSDHPSPNSKATWDDVRKKMIYVNASPTKPGTMKAPGDGMNMHNASSGSPTSIRREYDADSGITEGSRGGSVVSTSKIRMEPNSSNTIVRSTVLQSRSRDNSPVREIHREIHHYDTPDGKPTQSSSVNETVNEYHHYNDSPRGNNSSSTHVVRDVPHGNNTSSSNYRNNVVHDVHHNTGRGSNNVNTSHTTHVVNNSGNYGNNSSMYRDSSPQRKSGCCGGGNRNRYGHNSNRMDVSHVSRTTDK